MNKKILIYSDKIKSGKTTNLFRWIARQNLISGILQPVVEEKGFFYSIVDKILIQFEVSEEQSKKFSESQLVKIGSYFFLKSGFEKAKEILKRDFEKNYDLLVIDEIGPLELNGDGLEPVISEIVNWLDTFEGKLVLVVRDKLINDVIKKYKLEEKYVMWQPTFE
jgi:nucleoside-triphosphatase THEP1